MRALATLIAALLVAVRGGPRALADAGDKVTLRATMSAEEEVPKPGPPGGKGTGTFIIDADEGEVCYDISYSGIERPTAGRIHQGATGANGPGAVHLDLATKGNKGCGTEADEQGLAARGRNPDAHHADLSPPRPPG